MIRELSRILDLPSWTTYRGGRALCRIAFSRRSARFLLATVRISVISVAVFATLIATAYAFENWRGRRSWEKTKQVLKSRGEGLEMADFLPPPVQDDQNFAAAPFTAHY